MRDIGLIGLMILITNVLVSYLGFKDRKFFQKFAFEIDPILIGKDFKRLITSGFLHVGWTHLLFNMITFYFFSYSLEVLLGKANFLMIYFASLLGGNLLSLFIHRNHADYSAVGASGAVCGLIFASIALYPGMDIGLIFLPVYIPGWIFGLLFVLFSVYGIKTQRDNIGHDAHLGGGLVGMLVAIALYPQILSLNTVPILAVLIPASTFLFILAYRPELLYIQIFRNKRGFQTVEDRYHTAKKSREIELNELLDKIQKSGIDSLTKRERERLRELSN
ncbi:MAG: rhomboid family intramembrane serine protease [Saprospiraceae bacterium]|nr:rhomboid family intramembrane serine protease [Lewinellaceae bacterium]